MSIAQHSKQKMPIENLTKKGTQDMEVRLFMQEDVIVYINPKNFGFTIKN
jgi:hypothetical protein